MGKNISKNHDENHRLTKQERLLRIFLTSTAAVIFIGIYFWNPDAHPLTVCKFHQLTGVSCPTCGLSRSLHAAAHFRFFDSLKFHAAGWTILAALAFVFIWTLAEAISGEKIRSSIPYRQKKPIFFGLILLWLFSWAINVARDLNLL